MERDVMSFQKGASIITPPAVMCFSYLTAPDDKGKFRAELVFTEGTDISVVQDASDAVSKLAFPGKKTKSGVLTGERITTSGEPHDSAEGVIRPWSKAKPDGECGIVFRHIKDVQQKLSADEVRKLFYDGCVVRAAITPFSYDNDGNKGVSWFLNEILFVDDGNRIGGSDAASAFADACGIQEEDVVDSLLS
jgi:hypothetical protein